MLLKTSNSNFFRERRNRIVSFALLFAAIFCLLVAALGILLSLEFAKFKKTAVKTNAVITKTVYETAKGTFEPDRYSRDRRDAVIYIEYNINGIKYESVLRGLMGMTIFRGLGDRTGEEIEALYDPENPADVRSDRQAATYNVFIPVGIVLSAAFFILRKRLNKQRA